MVDLALPNIVGILEESYCFIVGCIDLVLLCSIKPIEPPNLLENPLTYPEDVSYGLNSWGGKKKVSESYWLSSLDCLLFLYLSEFSMPYVSFFSQESAIIP